MENTKHLIKDMVIDERTYKSVMARLLLLQ